MSIKYIMSLITAQEYRKFTGLPQRLQGVYFAKRLGIKFDRKIHDKKVRYKKFLGDLKNKLDDLNMDLIANRITRNKIDDFIIDSENNPEASVTINRKELDRKLKTTINGRDYFRNYSGNINAKFIKKLVANMPVKQGKFLMIKIRYFIIYQETEDVFDEIKYYVVNQLFLNNITKVTREEVIVTYQGFEPESVIQSIKFYYVKKEEFKRKKLEGGFFKYNLKKEYCSDHLLKILGRLQIFPEEHNFSEEKDENCLIHSLKLSGVSDQELCNLKLKCRNFTIPIKEIKTFAENSNFSIRVFNENTNQKRNVKYGNGEIEHKICLVDDHYFIYEPVEVTNFAIINYEKVKNEKEWWRINKIDSKGYFSREKKISNNSIRLVKTLIENNCFQEIKMSSNTLSMDNYKELINFDLCLDNKSDMDGYKLIEGNKISERQLKREETINKMYEECEKNIKGFQKEFMKLSVFDIYFDFETCTDLKYHKPYLVNTLFHASHEQKVFNQETFIGEDCGLQFLNYCFKEIAIRAYEDFGLNFRDKKQYGSFKYTPFEYFQHMTKITILAHNITYDMQFLLKYIHNYKPIFRAGNKLCGGEFTFNGIRFYIKDTFAIVSDKLASFPSMFNLGEMKKEIMPYDLYTNENVNKGFLKIEDALKYLKEDDKKQFLDNLKDLNLIIKNDYFNHINYAKYYCERDVKIMKEGLDVFRDWLGEQLHLCLDNFLTISSIADAYIKKEKCYDGCYQINGIARYYIQKNVVGGRCMSNRNKKYKLKKKINDLDGVSLYPSAIYRLANELGGFLKGKPKLIKSEDLNLNFLNKQDGYFIRIKINKIRKRRSFPTISQITENGIRNFTNSLKECDTFYVDKISMTDLIKYHELKKEDYEILDGYYFNEGRNNLCGNIVKKLFDIRVNFKNMKNPIEVLYKLILNSLYGKTIMKEKDTEIHFIKGESQRDIFISRNYNSIVEIKKILGCDMYEIKLRKGINDHFNSCHIGSEILSMSKRIMNEVMCLAEDLGIKIYYQDTDSMHIENDKISFLSDEFKKLYGRDLIGKNLGQFHCDFAQINGKDENGNNIKINPKYAIETIILGKKSYYDKVLYENGEIREHFRMKGIPSYVILKLVKDNKFKSIYDLYNLLYDGDEYTFDLLTDINPKFKVENGKISTARKFTRTLTFPDNIPIAFELEESEEENEDEEFEENYEEIFDEIEYC